MHVLDPTRAQADLAPYASRVAGGDAKSADVDHKQREFRPAAGDSLASAAPQVERGCCAGFADFLSDIWSGICWLFTCCSSQTEGVDATQPLPPLPVELQEGLERWKAYMDDSQRSAFPCKVLWALEVKGASGEVIRTVYGNTNCSARSSFNEQFLSKYLDKELERVRRDLLSKDPQATLSVSMLATWKNVGQDTFSSVMFFYPERSRIERTLEMTRDQIYAAYNEGVNPLIRPCATSFDMFIDQDGPLSKAECYSGS